MLNAYVDESGTHDGTKVMCVAGLVYDQQRLQSLDDAWREALESVGVEYFRASESAALRGAFKNVPQPVEDRLYRQLVGIVTRHVCEASVAFTTSEKLFDDFSRTHAWPYSQYTTTAYACISNLLLIAKIRQDDLHITIERGHKDMRELAGLLKKLSDKGLIGSYGFDDKSSRPLQTADLWAYECWKHVNDAVSDRHRVRKSLEELLDGTTTFTGLDDGTLPILFEQLRKDLRAFSDTSGHPET